MTKKIPIFDEDHLKELLLSIDEQANIDELYASGQRFLAETIERVRSLEMKAVAFVAYSIAVITFLLTTPWLSTIGPVGTLFAALVVLCSITSSAFSLATVSLTRVSVASFEAWLNPNYVAGDYVQLRRFRVLDLAHSISSQSEAEDIKSWRLLCGETFLMCTCIYLVLAFFCRLLGSKFHLSDGAVKGSLSAGTAWLSLVSGGHTFAADTFCLIALFGPPVWTAWRLIRGFSLSH